jgi:hypothetical protein
MNEFFASLTHALEPHGITAHLQNPWQLVISTETRPVSPDRGNSFWIMIAGGRCYLGTWTPACYRLPRSADVAALCVDFMQHDARAASVLPDELIAKYETSERLSQEELDALVESVGGDKDRATMTCSACDYDLRGIRDRGVCPECGRPLRHTLARQRKRGRRFWLYGSSPFAWLHRAVRSARDNPVSLSIAVGLILLIMVAILAFVW